MASLAQRLQSPWRDRRGRFSSLKAATLLLMLVPAYVVWAPVAADGVGPKPEIYLIYATGVAATALLLLSLAVTPARRVLGLSQLIIVRRMIGVSALVYTLLHVVDFVALNDYSWFKLGLEFRRPTVWIATASTLGFVALGATSFDIMISKLGANAWNRLHSLTYILTALGILHFLLSRASIAGMPFLMTGIYFWLMGWRLLDRFGKGKETPWLIGLAIVVTVLSFVFEATWLFFYRHYPFVITLRSTFSFKYDLASTWQVLILGLIVALVPAALARRRMAVERIPAPLAGHAPGGGS